MDDDRKDGLVALFWIGRGDAEPAEWAATMALARQQHEGLVSAGICWANPRLASF